MINKIISKISSHKKHISYLITLVFIVFIVMYVLNNLKEFEKVFHLSILLVLILTMLTIFKFLLLGFFNKIILYNFNIFLKPIVWVGLAFVTAMGNLLTPFRGGAGIRAIYLKKQYSLNYSNFLSTIAGIYFLTFLINSFIGAITVLLIYYIYGIINYSVLFFFSGLFLFFVIIISLSPDIPEFRNKLLGGVSRVIRGWYKIKKNKKMMFNLIIVIFINSIVTLFIIHFSFLSISINLPLIKCLFLSTLLTFSNLTNITPGGLGIREGIVVLGSKLFLISTPESLLAAGIFRIISMVIVFTLGPIFSYVLLKNCNEKKV